MTKNYDSLGEFKAMVWCAEWKTAIVQFYNTNGMCFLYWCAWRVAPHKATHTRYLRLMANIVNIDEPPSQRPKLPSYFAQEYWKIGKADSCCNCVLYKSPSGHEIEPSKNWLGGRYSAFFLLCADADWIYKYSGWGVLSFLWRQATLLGLWAFNKGRSMDFNKAGELHS